MFLCRFRVATRKWVDTGCGRKQAGILCRSSCSATERPTSVSNSDIDSSPIGEAIIGGFQIFIYVAGVLIPVVLFLLVIEFKSLKRKLKKLEAHNSQLGSGIVNSEEFDTSHSI